MFTIYETPQERKDAWQAKHLVEHPGCTFFMPECKFYTEEKLVIEACRILDESETYDRMFKDGSMWQGSDVFVETRKHLIAGFVEMNKLIRENYVSSKSLKSQYRSDLISHVLERGRDYDVYDAGWRIHAGLPSVEVNQDPLCTIMTTRIHVAVDYLMSRKQDVTKYA